MWLIYRVWVSPYWSWYKTGLLQWNGNSPVGVVTFIGRLCWMSLVVIIILSWQVNEVSWPLVISGVSYIPSSDADVIVAVFVWHFGYWMKSMLHIPWNEDGLCDAGLSLVTLKLRREKWNLLMVLWWKCCHRHIFWDCCCWNSWWFLWIPDQNCLKRRCTHTLLHKYLDWWPQWNRRGLVARSICLIDDCSVALSQNNVASNSTDQNANNNPFPWGHVCY